MPNSFKRYIFFLLILALQGFFSGIPARAQGRVIHITWSDEANKNISEENISKGLDFLAGELCEGRATGTRGSIEASSWIARRFSSAGLMPVGGSYFHSFTADNGKIARNVIGFFPGSPNAGRQRYVIVAANYDGYGIMGGKKYPGADSNCSGVVAMLEIAGTFARMQKMTRTYNKSIIFVALDAKRLNMGGAKALWSMVEAGELKDPQTGETVTKDKISLMVNLDQLGSSLSPLSSGRKDYLIALCGSNPGYFILLSDCNDRYGTGLELASDYYGSKDFTRMFYRNVSEQKPFLDHGVPAVMFTSGITMNNNKPADTPSTLDIPVLKKRIFLIFEWLEKV